MAKGNGTVTKNKADVDLGTKIRVLRSMRKLSIESVAINTGISLDLMQKYEAGEASISFAKLNELSVALGVSLFELVPDQYKMWGEGLLEHSNLGNRMVGHVAETIGVLKANDQIKFLLLLDNFMKGKGSSDEAK